VKVVIKYKGQLKETVRRDIRLVSMTEKDKKNDSIYIVRKDRQHGTYFHLKDMIFLDIEED